MHVWLSALFGGASVVCLAVGIHNRLHRTLVESMLMCAPSEVPCGGTPETIVVHPAYRRWFIAAAALAIVGLTIMVANRRGGHLFHGSLSHSS